MKKVSVVFTRNNARILIGSLGLYGKIKGVLVEDADLSEVQRIPPHHWKFEGGKIVPMTQEEVKARDKDIEINGVENDILDCSEPVICESIFVKAWKLIKTIWR